MHGFGLMMVLGVSQRFLPAMLGFSPVGPGLSKSLFAAMNLAVLGEAGAYVLFRRTGNPAWAVLAGLSVIVLALGAVLLVRALGIFRPVSEAERSLKFVRAAYVWLLLSLAMLVRWPILLRVTGSDFSHAYYGASPSDHGRLPEPHDLGVAAKVARTLAGADPRRLTPLFIPFVLVNPAALCASCSRRSRTSAHGVPPAGILGIPRARGSPSGPQAYTPISCAGILHGETGSSRPKWPDRPAGETVAQTSERQAPS